VTRALILAGLVALAAAGCGGGGDKSAQTTTGATTLMTTNPTGTASKPKFDYPPEVTRNFMQSCLKSPKTTRAYCSCTLDKLASNVSTKDFARIGSSGGTIPPRIRKFITQAAVACRNKL
jgi:hypothetical protein